MTQQTVRTYRSGNWASRQPPAHLCPEDESQKSLESDDKPSDADLRSAEVDEAEMQEIEQTYGKSTGYYAIISTYPQHPSDAEYVELFQRYQEGSLEARDELLWRNMRLIAGVALRYSVSRHGIELEELIHEGVPGLMKALDYFDPKLGYRFSTYATWWVRQSITRAVENLNYRRHARIPIHAQHKYYLIYRTTKRLVTIYGREPTAYEVYASIKQNREMKLSEAITLYDIAQMIRLFRSDTSVSLDSLVHASDDQSSTLYGSTPNLGIIRPDEMHEYTRLFEAARRLLDVTLNSLSKTDEYILRSRFFFSLDEEERTLTEVGNEFNLTRERIRQMEVRGFRLIRMRFGIRKNEMLRLGLTIRLLEQITRTH